jgi:hypothetical protein
MLIKTIFNKVFVPYADERSEGKEGMILNMAIYAIADLHLSFGQNKPMEIFREQVGKS